jgi:signal transduction histidine kinase
MSITAKFRLGLSLFLFLIVLIAATGYVSLVNVGKAEKSILNSLEIQQLVLDMDRGMEKSRRLYGDFFLQYPVLGLAEAHQQYIQPSIRQIAQVILISQALKDKIEQSHVSQALQKTGIDLNLYLSSAKRFADTSIQSVELVTEVSAPDRGFEAVLINRMQSLKDELSGYETLLSLHHEMEGHIHQYRIGRKRFMMQSAFNAAFRFRQQLEKERRPDAGKKERISAALDQSMEIADKITEADGKIKSIINDLSLQEKTVSSISGSLVRLAAEEVKQARDRIEYTHNTAALVMAAIALCGLLAALGAGRVLNRSITQKLIRLTKTAKEIREGNLDVSFEGSGEDEIGQLAFTFNMMTARIKEFVDTLEAKVAHRTDELKASNEKLLKEMDDRIKAETEKKNLEGRLSQAHKMEAIGTLAGGIAHDFNNILGAIIGYADLIKYDIPEGNPAKAKIEKVLKAADRAKNLVKQILAFSRKSQMSRTPVQIHLIMKEAVHLLRASIPSTIRILEEIDPECGSVLADQTQIHQVILNLGANAAQAMETQGGALHIALTRVDISPSDIFAYPGLKPGPHVKLRVKDTGTGIDKKIMSRIFDPYFTTKDIGKGSGMGLAMVHGIVKSHEGVIHVESEAGSGAVFDIYLPSIKDALPVPENTPDAPLTGTGHILVVDDEPAIADTIRMRLELLGYRVTMKTSSLEALEAFRQYPGLFDLVITDQTMPHLTGEKMAREMILIQNHIPIILNTGYSSLIDEEKLGEIGIRAFLMKPVRMEELSECVGRILSGQK